MDQIRLLTRTFFGRLFESDLMPEGLPQVQLVLWGSLLAATPTTGYPMILSKKYALAQFYVPLGPEFDADRVILITLSMMAIGVVGLVVWDGVFPDRRDVRILGTLPVSTGRFVIARLAALVQAFALFVLPICVLQSIFFPLLVAGYGDPVSRVHGIAAHFVTVVLACTFLFWSMVAAQCLLLLGFGRRAAQGASAVFQVLFAVALVLLVVFVGEVGRVMRAGRPAHEGLTALSALPQAWFLGLYETLAGTGDATSSSFAAVAAGAALASVALAFSLYALCYSHLARRALEGPSGQGHGHASASRAGILRRLPRSGPPLRRAVRQFAVRTLIRSRTHRMMLAIYAGIALAIVLSSAVSVAMVRGGTQLWRPNLAMLSMPLVIQFCLMVGIRAISAVPCEPKARWIFRACEPADRADAISGTRDTMVRLVVQPTAGLALAQGAIFWSPWAALAHAAFCLIVGLLLAELLVARTDKLPFACTYFPGRSRVFTLWPLYLMIFFAYTLGLSGIEGALLTRPVSLGIFCAGAVAAARLLAWYRRYTLSAMAALRFEEEDPDALFQGFHLSEALASLPRGAGLR